MGYEFNSQILSQINLPSFVISFERMVYFATHINFPDRIIRLSLFESFCFCFVICICTYAICYVVPLQQSLKQTRFCSHKNQLIL